MPVDWNNDNIVNEYIAAAVDRKISWYENEVNTPSILRLLPEERVRLLDFGCGPGNFTSLLGNKFDVSGADSAEAMIKAAARKYSHIPFFVWDGSRKRPSKVSSYDAVVTKLTLEFVNDLSSIAKNLRAVLRTDGWLVFSVQHPLLAIFNHPEINISYWQMRPFDVQIGTTGQHATKIHRNLQHYITPFLENGFRLARIDEPEIPKAVAEKYGATPIDLKFPKRLNVQFRTI
jgi:trans-aconitate methyltransferase